LFVPWRVASDRGAGGRFGDSRRDGVFADRSRSAMPRVASVLARILQRPSLPRVASVLVGAFRLQP
jgi:hypothetical protein